MENNQKSKEWTAEEFIEKNRTVFIIDNILYLTNRLEYLRKRNGELKSNITELRGYIPLSESNIKLYSEIPEIIKEKFKDGGLDVIQAIWDFKKRE